MDGMALQNDSECIRMESNTDLTGTSFDPINQTGLLPIFSRRFTQIFYADSRRNISINPSSAKIFEVICVNLRETA
jgi:hypothetical protein